jgi:hypothetical protein
MNEQRDDLGPEEKGLLREQGGSLDALRAHHQDCPRLEILLASRAGVLPEETARTVEAHLVRCTFCQILLKDVTSEGLVEATAEEEVRVRQRVLAGRKPEVKTAKTGGLFAVWFWRAVPVTALAAVAVALVVWVRWHQPATPITSPTVTEQTTKPAAPSVLQWEKLPVKLQASSILVLRGATRTGREKYAAELTSALGSYRDDNYKKAAKQLADVVKDFPHGVEGQLYLGVSQLRLGQNAEAMTSLRAAQRLGPEQFRDDATWYLALAYDRSGDVRGALAELQKLCQGKSGYAQRACSAATEQSGQLGEKLPR